MSTKKRQTKDRKQQVQTTKLTHGNDHYEKIGAMGATFKDKGVAKLAAMKRWHPDYFDEEGNILPKFEDKIYASND